MMDSDDQCGSLLLALLPDGCLLDVFRLLEAEDLARCQRVCWRFHSLCCVEALWRPLAAARWPCAAARSPPCAHGARAWFGARAVAGVRWNAARPLRVLPLTGHQHTVFGVCAHPLRPNIVLSAGEDGLVRTWDCTTGALLAATDARLGGCFNVHAWSDQGCGFVAAAGFSGDISLMSLGTDGAPASATRVVLAAHAAPVVSVRARGDLLASCSFDGSVRLWRVSDAVAQKDKQRLHTTPLSVLSDVPATPEAVQHPHEFSVAAVCLPPGSESRLARGGNDGLLKVWDLTSQKVVQALAGHTGWIWCLESCGDAGGNVLLSGATDSTVRCWDLRVPGSSVVTLREAGPVAGLAVRPQVGEQRFATGSFDGSVRLFDLRMRPVLAPHQMQEVPLVGHQDRVTRVAATDAFVVSASFDTTLRVWRFDDL